MISNRDNCVLSLILCSRNDAYLGNSRWRLQTALNYAADQCKAIGRTDDVEILVSDWGSEVPLGEVICLTPTAAQIVSFLHIPPEIAQSRQKDSPFPEVLALNAAARRARGQFIGRIDQDTLVGGRFLKFFFELHEGKRQLGVPLGLALLYANRRAIPYWFAVLDPKLGHVERFVERFGNVLPITTNPGRPYWTYYVGIWLVPRDLWIECGGYDERFIYYNWMEVEMIMRLRQRYVLVDLGTLVDNDFYHLEHQNPRAWLRRRDLKHRINDFDVRLLETDGSALAFHPNSGSWGLAECSIDRTPSRKAKQSRETRLDRVAFPALLARTWWQQNIDRVLFVFRRLRATWSARAERIGREMRAAPIYRWPSIGFRRGMGWLGRRHTAGSSRTAGGDLDR